VKRNEIRSLLTALEATLAKGMGKAMEGGGGAVA